MSDMLSVEEACELLELSPTTLWRYRKNGGGPRFICPIRGRYFYRRRDIEKWLESRTYSHTSELDAVEAQAKMRLAAQKELEG